MCAEVSESPTSSGGAGILPGASAENGIEWHEAQTLTLEGQGWGGTEYPFDRLPERARACLPKSVWSFSKHTSGLCFRFRTDSPSLVAQWRLSYRAQIPHMSAAGLSGIDLYARSDSGWGWVATGFPSHDTNCEAALFECGPTGMHEYLLYLPLCARVRSLRLGIRPGSVITDGANYPQERTKALCFYGTSMTQGVSASRAGMSYTAILGRWFQMPVVNLGFSGSGKMDLPMSDLLAEVDMALCVVDCTANMSPKEIEERAVPFVTRLRSLRTTIPILMTECPPYQSAWFLPDMRRRYVAKNVALRSAYVSMIESGVTDVYYIGASEYGMADGESAVGNHCTDLAFMRVAKAVRGHIERILQLEAVTPVFQNLS